MFSLLKDFSLSNTAIHPCRAIVTPCRAPAWHSTLEFEQYYVAAVAAPARFRLPHQLKG